MKRCLQQYLMLLLVLLSACTASARRPLTTASDFTGVGTVKAPAELPQQFIERHAYIVSYCKVTRSPNWVAWHLTAENTDGPYTRKGMSYTEDRTVGFPRATNADFHRSGYSRGHLCPAADNKWSMVAMQEAFLLSNVCAQDRSLNSGHWNRIEQSCRRWAKRYGDIYIITGPFYLTSKKLQFIGKNRVAVPDGFFKVVLRLGKDPQAIGFIYRNSDGGKKKPLHVNTLADVERITHYTFFPEIQGRLRQQLWNNADIKNWSKK